MLIHMHSGFRWLVLIMLLVAIINGVIGLFNGKEFAKKDKMINLITLALFHLQIVIGIVLYFVSGKVSFSNLFDDIIFRYFTLEHPALMLLTAAIFTIGYRKIKKAEESRIKFRRTIWWFLGTLALVMYAIPWSAVYGANLF